MVLWSLCSVSDIKGSFNFSPCSCFARLLQTIYRQNRCFAHRNWRSSNARQPSYLLHQQSTGSTPSKSISVWKGTPCSSTRGAAWNPYITHNKFLIRTDQRSLKFLLEQKITTPFQHMWLSKLMGYTFEIQYKQGKENVAADALSRVSGSQLLNLVLSQIHHSFYDNLKRLWDSDPNLKKFIKDFQSQPAKHFAYSFINGELRRKGKLIVGNDQGVKTHIFQWLHNSAAGGHSRKDSTLQRIKSLFFWPKMSWKHRTVSVLYLLCLSEKQIWSRCKTRLIATASSSCRCLGICKSWLHWRIITII